MSNLEIFHHTAMKPGHCAMRLNLRQLFYSVRPNNIIN